MQSKQQSKRKWKNLSSNCTRGQYVTIPVVLVEVTGLKSTVLIWESQKSWIIDLFPYIGFASFASSKFLLFWDLIIAPRINLLSISASSEKHGPNLIGYIDVGDGCWRPTVLVTILGCWWRDLLPRVRHQHQISDTNITLWRIMMLMTDVSTSGFVKR